MSRFASEVSRFPGQPTGTDGGGHGGTYPLKGVCPPASVPIVPGQMSTLNVPLQDKAAAKPSGSMRVHMPVTAGIVDELRQAWGAARVDAAIATGVRLQREHARIQATQGQVVADRWLRLQRVPAGCFMSTEAGRTVGAMP